MKLANKVFMIVGGFCLLGFSLPVFGGIRIADIIYVSVGSVLIALRGCPARKIDIYVFISGGLLAAGMSSSSLLAGSDGYGYYQAARYLGVFTLGYSTLRLLSSKSLVYLHKVAYFSTFLLSCFSLFIYIFKRDWGMSNEWIQSSRLAMWFAPNSLSFIFANGLLLALYFWIRGYGSGWINFILFLTISASLLLTMSFGGFITAAVMIVCFLVLVFLFVPEQRRRFVSFFGVLIIGGAVSGYLVTSNYSNLASFLPERLETRVLTHLTFLDTNPVMQSEGLGSYEVRLFYLQRTYEEIRNSPVWGVGASSKNALEVYAHNLPILLWLEGGVTALLGYILFVCSYFGFLIRSIYEQKDRFLCAYGLSVGLGYFVTTLIHPHMYQFHYYFLLFGIIAIMLKEESCVTRTEKVLYYVGNSDMVSNRRIL